MMGKRRGHKNDDSFVLFDVVYEDGARSSRRKIPAADVGGLDGDKAVGALIEAQDRKIAELSGVKRGPVKSFIRSPGQ
jgi:hypothetical protein